MNDEVDSFFVEGWIAPIPSDKDSTLNARSKRSRRDYDYDSEHQMTSNLE